MLVGRGASHAARPDRLNRTLNRKRLPRLAVIVLQEPARPLLAADHGERYGGRFVYGFSLVALAYRPLVIATKTYSKMFTPL